MIIAHNAKFDRRFAEEKFHVFKGKNWACSMSQVPWRTFGFESLKLEYLAFKHDFFYDAHRAETDCNATIELLSRTLSGKDNSEDEMTVQALLALLEQARKPSFRIPALGAPFEAKDTLKARGYRWRPNPDRDKACWYKDVSEDAYEAEMTYLKEHVYQRDIDLPAKKITALNRFSIREDEF